MKHYLKNESEHYSIYKMIDAETGDSITIDSSLDIQTYNWGGYTKDHLITLLKNDYVESSKEQFESFYIQSVEKLNKITSNL